MSTTRSLARRVINRARDLRKVKSASSALVEQEAGGIGRASLASHDE